MAEIEDLELEFADLSEHAAIIEALWQEASLARRYGDLDPALDAYCRILEMDNGHAEAMLAAAEVCRLSGHSHDALQFCVDLLELEPRHIGGRLEMAENLRLLGQADDAHAIHDLLLLERPDSPHSWCGLARLLADEGKQSGAEACLRRALALDPAHAPAWAALGRGLLSESRVEEALDALHATLILEPECTAHHVAMTEALIALGRYDEARPHLDRALALDDEDVHARLAQAHLLALDGHLTQAFHEAQCRWHLPGRGRPLLPGCPWDGEDLEASTLLLHAEGNLGDTIRMARFLPILAERGARLVVMAPLALKTVLANLPGVEAVLPDDAPPPEDLEADYVAPLMDLPGLLGVELTSIPNASYLVPPPERIRTIRVPAHTQVKVGLAWVSDTAAGDVPLDRLLRLSCIPGILLFSLQTGPRAAEAPALAEPSLITDLSPTIADFADLAGRIAEMDVVITADCATAHLAAALGKPVWLMLAHAAAALWLRDRTDSPWYQDMVLLRQAVPGNWNTVMETVTSRLVRLRDQMAERDAGDRAATTGSHAAQQALLAAHLQAGDLFLDVGAEDGFFTFEAASHPSGAILALAIEPSAMEAEILRDSLAISGLEEITEVITAAAGAAETTILASRRPHGGSRVFALPPWRPATTPMVPLSQLLDERPHLAHCRKVVRINQRGWEAPIIEGLNNRAAIIIFEHRDGDTAAALLAAAGYGLWRFPEETAHGPVIGFDQSPGTILALAPGLTPAAHYGPSRLPPSPAALNRIREEAEAIAAEGIRLQRLQRTTEAARCFGEALAKDPFCLSANANLGVLQHMAGRLDGAAACYARALTRQTIPAIQANLGNALRELRRFAEAESMLDQALAAEPDNGEFLYAMALLNRDQGMLAESMPLMIAAQARQPDSRRLTWSRTQLHLAMGDLAEGLARLDSRPTPVSRAAQLPVWTGEDLAATSLLVETDEDYADIILLARFIPLVAARGALINIACPDDLVPLLADLGGVEQAIGPDTPLPPCEMRVGLASLPRLLGATDATGPAGCSYLDMPVGGRGRRSSRDDRLRVGVTWGGRRAAQACPLATMLALAGDPALTLVALAQDEQSAQLEQHGARALMERTMPPPADLGEMATLILGLDVIIGTDTAYLHLAAALGKPVLALLPGGFDWRWPEGRDDTPWYASARVFRKDPHQDWRDVMDRIATILKVMAARKLRR